MLETESLLFRFLFQPGICFLTFILERLHNLVALVLVLSALKGARHFNLQFFNQGINILLERPAQTRWKAQCPGPVRVFKIMNITPVLRYRLATGQLRHRSVNRGCPAGARDSGNVNIETGFLNLESEFQGPGGPILANNAF